MEIKIRKAQPSDAGQVEAFMYSAGPEFYDYSFTRFGKTALDYIGFEFISGRGPCGYQNITIIEDDSGILGTVGFYGEPEAKAFVGASLKNIFKFYGFFNAVRVMYRMFFLRELITTPKPSELYIVNLGISPNQRGRGLGTLLLNHIEDQAKARGMTLLSLDVSAENPRAEQLYERLGFSVISTTTLPKSVNHLPSGKRMERRL